MAWIDFLSPKTVIKMLNFWPPFLFSGIRIIEVSEDLSKVRVRLKRFFWNQNYFGTHFGGSLYSMTDPFFPFMLLEQIKKEHIVWDKKGDIEYIKAVQEDVFADFQIFPTDVEEIKHACLNSFSIEKSFEVIVKTKNGDEVARVNKTLYIRRKDAKKRFEKTNTDLLI